MSTMTNLFEALSQERASLLDTLKGLPDVQLDQKGVVGEWSIKNVLAHLTSWEVLVTEFLPERFATGQRPAVFSEINADEDAWNAREVASREQLTPREQLDELARTRQGLLQMLRNLGEEALDRQHPWPEWEGTLASYILQEVGGHEREHSEAVVAAVEQLRGA